MKIINQQLRKLINSSDFPAIVVIAFFIFITILYVLNHPILSNNKERKDNIMVNALISLPADSLINFDKSYKTKSYIFWTKLYKVNADIHQAIKFQSKPDTIFYIIDINGHTISNRYINSDDNIHKVNNWIKQQIITNTK